MTPMEELREQAAKIVAHWPAKLFGDEQLDARVDADRYDMVAAIRAIPLLAPVALPQVGEVAQAFVRLCETLGIAATAGAYLEAQRFVSPTPTETPTAAAPDDGLMGRWRPIETAPYDTRVLLKVGSMTFPAKLHKGVSMDEDGNDCDQWSAIFEGEHPPCWSGGACWASNEDEMPSIQPSAWKALSTATGDEGGK